MPVQEPREPVPDPVAVAVEAARLFRVSEREALTVLLLADEPLRVAVAACRLLGEALAGIDRLNAERSVEQH